MAGPGEITLARARVPIGQIGTSRASSLFRAIMLTVEVVEDDLYMRTLISEWLSSDGYRVQARATLGDHPRRGVAAVVVELRNGPGQVEETIERAKRVYPQAPLIGVSAQLSQTPQGDSKRAQEIGVRRLVAKPCTRVELLEAVSQAIRAGR